MGRDKYWSVEDCCWVDCPEPDGTVRTEVAVPVQRADEPAQEPVEA